MSEIIRTMKYRFLFILFFSLSFIEAQEVISITKKEFLQKVLENNNNLKISQQDIFAAEGDYKQTNAVIAPKISVSHTGIATTNPLMAFGSKLNQEVLTQSDFNPVLLNNPAQVQNFATTIAVQQPLINLKGIYQRKAVKTKLNAITLQSERTKDYISLEAEKAYMQLQLSYKTVEILESIKKEALENKRLVTNSFKQGFLQKTDVLSIDIRVLEIENQIQYATSNVKNASNYVSFLMNSSADEILKPSDKLVLFLFDETKNTLSKERSDIKAMQLSTEAHKTMFTSEKMAFLPTLNAFGSYELYDDNLFNADANGYLFGVQLSWTILDGTKRFGKAQKSKATYEKAKIEYDQYVSKSNLEFKKSDRALIDAKNNVKLSLLALNQSKESLRIRTNRFKQGLEKTTDLLSSETTYAQKQLAYYQAVYNYNYALAYIKYLTKE